MYTDNDLIYARRDERKRVAALFHRTATHAPAIIDAVADERISLAKALELFRTLITIGHVPSTEPVPADMSFLRHSAITPCSRMGPDGRERPNWYETLR